jgi:hypothetical protein
MIVNIVPSIFDSFNARALEPNQVARTFVPSDAYERLAKRCNTVIVGPRGSGKTTLLKMLQQPALEAWDDTQAEQYCRRIDFTGTFVSTDVSWSEQLDALGDESIDTKTHRLLSVSAFTTHTLHSLVEAMLDRLEPTTEDVLRQFRRVSFPLKEQAELARVLRTAWHVGSAIPSLLSVKHALTARLAQIKEIASQEAVWGPEGRQERLASIPFLHIHFIQAAALAVEKFNDIAKEKGGKWALMFDELELAPPWIREYLLRSLRGSSRHFLFKLAMSPSAPDVHTFEGALSAAPGHDFEQIALWYAERNDGYAFCERLWYSMLSDRGLEAMEPREVLGRSEFETGADEWSEAGTAYTPGSRLGKRFIRFSEVDSSFRAYLERRNIDPYRLEYVEGGQRAADVRKVAPLLAVREFYRSESKRRPRKSAVLYAGADSIFAISEGNPRWFIALVGRLLDAFRRDERKIPPSVQARELRNATERFAAMLRTIPAPTIGQSSRGLLSIVKEVGEFFHQAVVDAEFNPDPPGTFTVDSKISDEVVSSLERALNAGAVVYVPDDVSQIVLRSLRGKRFRLSYLLAPLYGFPLRLGRPVALGGVLADSNVALKQMSLPGDGVR